MSETTDFTRPVSINWNNSEQTVGVVDYGSKNLSVMFHTNPVHNPAKSKEAGTPQYDDVVYVRIAPPGERLNIIDRPVTDVDKQKYAQQWYQFQQNRQQRPSGTPVSLLFPMQPSITAMLEGAGVWTVEQLGDLSASAIENIGMGCQRYVNDAKKYLEVAARGVKGSQLREELDARDAQIRVLTHQIEQLSSTVDKLLKERGKETSTNDLKRLIQEAMHPVPMRGAEFDAQTAVINATGAAIRPKAKAKKQEAAPKQKRQRVVID